MTSHRTTSVSPHCSTPSSAIHSSYRSKPRDLPCAGRPIRLLLSMKKFFCRQAQCSHKIFTERMPDLIGVSSRRTKRLRSAVQEIGVARLSAKEESAWLRSSAFPSQTRPLRASKLDPYEDYILARLGKSMHECCSDPSGDHCHGVFRRQLHCESLYGTSAHIHSRGGTSSQAL